MFRVAANERHYKALTFNPAPVGNARFPKAATILRQQMENAWASAVLKGHATEDDSEGYTLTDDPKTRSAELAIRDYALQNEALIL